MKFYCFIFITLLTLLYPQTLCAKAIEIRSENFTLRGDVKENDGAELVRDLEFFRENLFKLYDRVDKPEVISVPIYIVQKERDMEFVVGTKAFHGMYITTMRGPVFILNAKRGFGRNSQARHTALHEYTHHVTANFVSDFLPLWYNEGYANYLSTFTSKGETFKIGEPNQRYGSVLRGKNWMPMSVILASTQQYPFNKNDTSKIGQQTISQFYAQTWLATHYMHTQEGMQDKMVDYIKRINKGEGSIKAFKDATGFTPETFETTLKAYVKRNKFPVTQVTIKTARNDIPLSIRDLTETERNSYLYEAKQAFVYNPQTAKKAEAAMLALEAKIGKRANIIARRAESILITANSREELVAARNLAEEAFKLDKNNIDSNRVLGGVIVSQYVRNLGGQETEMPMARSYLKKVLQHNSNDPMANYFYAASYAFTEKVPLDALTAARFAMEYYRDRSFLGNQLNMAGILANAGDYAPALKTISLVKIWSRDMQQRMQAQSLKKYIEDRQKWGE